jgi:UDP-galactopyranose mutase
MEKCDVVVVGGGISGTAFAWKAAQSGREVLLLERSNRLGGCLHSHRLDDGFWFEMGAHTTYNSYGGFLEIAAASGATEHLIPRGPARTRFGLLRQGEYSWLTPPRLLLKFSWIGILFSFPFGILRGKKKRTMSEYFGGLLGRANYERFLKPFLAAVPSQSADGFPAEGPGSLFKKRVRREEYPRSFGFDGGLQSVCEKAAGTANLKVRRGVEVERVVPRAEGFTVKAADGAEYEAVVAAVAAPLPAAISLLRENFPALAETLGEVETVDVESVGVVLPRKKCWMPEIAFLVPTDDIFWSAVTRDPFPDPERRAFAFHFKPGHSREEKLRRMSEILKVDAEDLEDAVEKRLSIPAPARGHGELIAKIDAGLLSAPGRLALTGNFFQGLAIEDCIQRSFEECTRVLS